MTDEVFEFWRRASSERAEACLRALVDAHARELASNPRFRRTGRLTPDDVHQVAVDLDRLAMPHRLDETIDAVLCRFDALELEREGAQ